MNEKELELTDEELQKEIKRAVLIIQEAVFLNKVSYGATVHAAAACIVSISNFLKVGKPAFNNIIKFMQDSFEGD